MAADMREFDVGDWGAFVGGCSAFLCVEVCDRSRSESVSNTRNCVSQRCWEGERGVS